LKDLVYLFKGLKYIASDLVLKYIKEERLVHHLYPAFDFILMFNVSVSNASGGISKIDFMNTSDEEFRAASSKWVIIITRQ